MPTFDPMSAKAIHVFDDHAAGIYALCKGAGNQLFSASADKHVAAWDIDSLQPTGFAIRMQQAAYGLGYLADLNQLLIGNAHGGFHVVDLETRQEVRLLDVHKRGVFGFCHLAKQDQLVVTGGDGSFSLWQLPDYQLIRQIPISGSKIRKAIQLGPQVVAFADGDGPIQVLSTETMNPVMTLDGHQRGTNCLAYHPEKPVLVSGGRDAHLRVWNLESGLQELAIAAHNYGIYDLSFSPDSSLLVTVSFDKTVKLWDAESMQLIQRFERPSADAHFASVNALQWLSDKRFATAGDDKRIIIWEVL